MEGSGVSGMDTKHPGDLLVLATEMEGDFVRGLIVIAQGGMAVR